MPGGGAEIFSERVRRLLFPQKIGAKGWFEVHKTAHRLGIPTNSTMLYGHCETLEQRLVHMMKLREAQDETGGFLTFIPLAFQPGATGIKPKNRFTSAIDDLTTNAISRLMLDNFPHIRAYWVMLTEEVAAMALNFGADDRVGMDRDAIMAARAVRLAERIAQNEVEQAIAVDDAPQIVQQTGAQFLARLREIYRKSDKERCARIARWIVRRIDAGHVTVAQLRNVFNLTVGEWNTLEAKLRSPASTLDALEGAQGE